MKFKFSIVKRRRSPFSGQRSLPGSGGRPFHWNSIIARRSRRYVAGWWRAIRCCLTGCFRDAPRSRRRPPDLIRLSSGCEKGSGYGMAGAVSALFLLDIKGRVLVWRDYRGDVSAVQAERFFTKLIEKEVCSSLMPPAKFCFHSPSLYLFLALIFELSA